jgi:hypothetical protein
MSTSNGFVFVLRPCNGMVLGVKEHLIGSNGDDILEQLRDKKLNKRFTSHNQILKDG